MAETVRERFARRAKEAEAGVAAKHNSVQPFALLPDVMQRVIIDLLPSGRCVQRTFNLRAA